MASREPPNFRILASLRVQHPVKKAAMTLRWFQVDPQFLPILPLHQDNLQKVVQIPRRSRECVPKRSQTQRTRALCPRRSLRVEALPLYLPRSWETLHQAFTPQRPYDVTHWGEVLCALCSLMPMEILPLRFCQQTQENPHWVESYQCISCAWMHSRLDSSSNL